MSALLELADRVERYVAKGHYDLDRDTERGLNEAIGLAIGVGHRIRVGDPALGNDRWVPSPLKPYVTSLDAAMTLIPKGVGEELLAVMIKRSWRGEADVLLLDTLSGGKWASASASMAAAIVAAALRAKAVGEGV